MIFAPLVMPEVITGLLAAAAVRQPELDGSEGSGRLWSPDIPPSGTAYVAVVVQSRLLTFDMMLEEAAMDLGATPLKTFFVITLPVIAPALVSGWLLAFTLSLDDLVIASFTSRPGVTTLPMRIYSQVRLGFMLEINAIIDGADWHGDDRPRGRLARHQAPRGRTPARRTVGRRDPVLRTASAA